MNDLTKKQRMVLDFIRGHIKADGYSPSLSQISAALGWRSANAAYAHVVALRCKGYLKKTPRGDIPT